MAQLWAEKIMKAETEDERMELYKKVPRLLKEKVKSILISSGFENITERGEG